MAAVTCATIFFLAAIPIPGGASIRQTGTIPSFHAEVLPLSPITAQRMGAVRCAIWTARSGVHSWVSLCGSSRSVRDLALSLDLGGSQRVSNGDRLLRSRDPPNLRFRQ